MTRRARGEVAPDPADQVITRDVMLTGLADLSPRQRACVVLRCYDDLPVAQVASELGIAEGTVKPYLSEAMTRLAARLPPAERGWGGVNRWALTKTNCGSA